MASLIILPIVWTMISLAIYLAEYRSEDNE